MTATGTKGDVYGIFNLNCEIVINMEEKVLELKKHVGIIHCSNKLTLLQRKLSNALLYHAYGNLLSQENHKIKIGEIQKLIGYDSHDYDTLKKAFKALMSIVLEWNLLRKTVDINGKQYIDGIVDFQNKSPKETPGKAYSWHASSILASASIDGTMCTYSYSPEIRELLYMPEIYGKINLLVQSRFTSTYSLALYENCIRFKKLNRTGWISYEIFRQLMGVSENKYKKYKDFKKRVLDKAIEEINKLSDIYVSLEQKQDYSRQTFLIRFFLKSNAAFQVTVIKGKENLIENKTNGGNKGIDSKIQQILEGQFCLSVKQIKNIIANYNIDYILSKIELVQNSTSYKNKKIENIAAYFLSAIKGDFQYSGDKLIIKSKNNKNKRVIEAERQSKKEKEYNNYVAKSITLFLEKIDIKTRKEIDERFQKKMLKNPFKFIVEEYNKLGMKSSLVQTFYKDFIHENYSNLVGIMGLEDFIKNKVDKKSE